MLNHILEIIGFILGILYLYYEYTVNTRLWIVGIIMPLISMWVYFNSGLYADFAIAIYYFLAAVYGFWIWTRSKKAKTVSESSRAEGENTLKSDLPISHVPWATLFVSLGVTALLWVFIYYILVNFTNSTVPLCDSFTTALSITGMYLLAHKYVEQWIIWIIVDIVSSCLYYYKGIYFYSCLYGIYTIVACLGYIKWKKKMQEK